MRIGPICSVIVFTILLALPELRAAPKDDGSEKVLSQKIEKKSSKSSEKTAKVDEEQKQTNAKASNGLASGSRSISLSRDLTEKDEEQSQVAEEKTTTSGSQKSSESVNKKKLVSVSEKKNVLIYYMVSYKKLPKQRENEKRMDYYKRVFPKEDNLQVFYRKLFKCYEGEEPKCYIARIEYIFLNVYPELDCRLDPKWLQLFDHYYTVKYSRKVDEPDEHYLPRVLEKLVGESKEHYRKRMECMMLALDEEDFTHITFNDTELGYKIGIRKAPPKTKSSPSSSGLPPTNQMTSSTKKSKAEEVDIDQSESSIEKKDAKGSSSESSKNKKKTKTTVEKEENVKTFSYRVAYTKLPKKPPGELDEVYYKRFFGEYNCKMSEIERNEMYLRILIQYKGETLTEYVQRLDFLFGHVYKELDIRTNRLTVNMMEHYYRAKYEQCKDESDEQWFARVLTKLPGETVQHYKDRVACIQITIPEAKWNMVTIDAESSTGYKLKSVSSSSSSQTKEVTKKTLTEEEIKKSYAKQEKEDITAYYKRIVTKSTSVTTEEYSQTLTAIRKCYPNLALWYDVQYISLIKEYYTDIYTKQSSETEDTYFKRIVTKESFETKEQCAKRVDIVRRLYPNLAMWYDVKYISLTKEYYTDMYTKQSSETEDKYFKRIVTKESFETEEQCAKRVEIVRQVHPNLELWHDEKYYETLTKKIYSIVYKKGSCEDESTYYNRVCAKSEKEADKVYVGRMILIQKTCSAISLWYTEKYISIIKVYYTLKYTKKSCESVEDYYKRLVAKEACDTSDTIYAQRMHIVHTFTVSCAVWYDATFYEKYSKSYYTVYYKKGEKETCDAWLTRVIKQLTGELEENAINRIKLINKSKTGCNCWTSENIKKLECSKIFTKEYLDKVWKVVNASSIQIKKSSTSSSSKDASASESEDVTIIKRGKSC